MRISEPLIETYTASVYTVETGNGPVAFSLRPPHAGDRTVALPFVAPWAIITAHNPRSREVGAGTNAAAHVRLLARLQERAVAHLPATGTSPPGRPTWSEEGVLCFAGRDAVLELVREFDQHAAVFDGGGAAGLLFADGSFLPTGVFAPEQIHDGRGSDSIRPS